MTSNLWEGAYRGPVGFISCGHGDRPARSGPCLKCEEIKAILRVLSPQQRRRAKRQAFWHAAYVVMSIAIATLVLIGANNIWLTMSAAICGYYWGAARRP